MHDDAVRACRENLTSGFRNRVPTPSDHICIAAGLVRGQSCHCPTARQGILDVGRAVGALSHQLGSARTEEPSPDCSGHSAVACEADGKLMPMTRRACNRNRKHFRTSQEDSWKFEMSQFLAENMDLPIHLEYFGVGFF